LLASAAARLAAAFPDGRVARVGADSFAVTAANLKQETDAGTLLQDKLLAVFNRPFANDGEELRITARVGVAVYPSDAPDPETLYNNAEAALKEAQQSGARYLFYSPRLNSRVAEDLALEQQLLSALERSEFILYYQPKIAARSGELVGLEALLRWQPRKGAIVTPDRFIGVLEDTELIIDVGRWVVEQALADHRRWVDMNMRALPVAVNVSPIQLRYADFPDMILAALGHHGVPGSSLELEITESVIMSDIEAHTQRLEQIAAAGVSIAIDDFGTGYSSLRYLAKLPVDTLKIDRSFIVTMASDADSMTLVSTIVSLAHSFDLSVVAEGVDSEEQAHLLRLMKCDTLQGYLLGKPMPAAEIEKLLSRDDS
jgi:EAL domain-containing protein (putative c-di-GMP-specific phosphodiesterase class I)